MAFADLDDNMDLAEAMLKYVINYVLENAPEEMNFFNSFVDKGLLDRLHNVVSSEFAKVTYTEAVGAPGEKQRQVRVQGFLGNRPADRA